MTTASVADTTLDVRGVSLVTREAGDGETLLYLHDELSTGWNPYLDLLAERFHVVAPELPGFGDTQRPEWIEDIADVAFFVADIATQVGDGASVNVAGGSLGGWLAIEAALRGAPIARIVAIGSPGAQIAGDPPFDYFFLTPEERTEMLFTDPASKPEVSEDHAIHNESMTARLVWQPRYVSPKLLQRIHRMEVPTLVAWGELDCFLSLAHGKALADSMPNGSLVTVPGSGHFVALEKPTEVAQLTTVFLTGGEV